MTNGEDYKNAEELEANKLSLEEKKILLNLFQYIHQKIKMICYIR